MAGIENGGKPNKTYRAKDIWKYRGPTQKISIRHHKKISGTTE